MLHTVEQRGNPHLGIKIGRVVALCELRRGAQLGGVLGAPYGWVRPVASVSEGAIGEAAPPPVKSLADLLPGCNVGGVGLPGWSCAVAGYRFETGGDGDAVTVGRWSYSMHTSDG